MKRRIFIAAAVLALAALLPLLSAEPARGPLQRSLEAALSRPVKIQGKTHLRLFPWPALTAEDVTIAEDPAYSLEPFAYVAEISLQPRLIPLLSGRLEPGTLRLTEPSVNLMRKDGGWNVQSLRGKSLVLPDIQVRNGRLNFKQGDEKSAFYLINTLVDIGAPTARGDVDFFISAEPARTDRAAQGFGKFQLRGNLHFSAARNAEIDAEAELQPSAIHAFNFFFGARGVDFEGKFSSKVRLRGPVDKIAILGDLKFEGLGAQSFLPFTSKGNTIRYAGELDLQGQRLALDTEAPGDLRIRVRARNLFQQARGAMLLRLNDIELARLLQLGREANARIPANSTASGVFSAVVGYSWPAPADSSAAQGMLVFRDASFQLPEQPTLAVKQASVIVEGFAYKLQPAAIRIGEEQTARMEVDWNALSGALRLNVETRLLGMKGLKSGLGLVIGASNLPLLSSAQGGTWQGNLLYARKEDADPGAWSGRLNLRNTVLKIEGLPAPLEVSGADILFDPNRVAIRSMRAEADGVELEGEYAYYPQSARPAEFNLTLAEFDSSSLESILQAARRPSPGLLEKMRLRRAAMPDWLRTRRLTGRLLIKNFEFAAGLFHPLDVHVNWTGSVISARVDQAEFSLPNEKAALRVGGKLETDLWANTPLYTWKGEAHSWPTSRGPAEFEGRLLLHQLGENWQEDMELSGTLRPGAAEDTESYLVSFKQGKGTVEYGAPVRKAVPLASPFWPLELPIER